MSQWGHWLHPTTAGSTVYYFLCCFCWLPWHSPIDVIFSILQGSYCVLLLPRDGSSLLLHLHKNQLTPTSHPSTDSSCILPLPFSLHFLSVSSPRSMLGCSTASAFAKYIGSPPGSCHRPLGVIFFVRWARVLNLLFSLRAWPLPPSSYLQFLLLSSVLPFLSNLTLNHCLINHSSSPEPLPLPAASSLTHQSSSFLEQL